MSCKTKAAFLLHNFLISSIIFLYLLNCLVPTQIEASKSLFDDVPLNGALVTSDSDWEKLTDSKSAKTFSSPKKASLNNKEREDDSESPSSSLFDTLPNQGAFQTESDDSLENKNRNPRDSKDSSSVDFDITPIAPSSEFDLPYWDNRFLSPIIKSIANSNSGKAKNFEQNSKENPRKSSNSHQWINSDSKSYTSPQSFSNPSQIKKYAHKSERDGYTQRHNNRSHSNSVSAISGGPTVIVYPPDVGSTDSENKRRFPSSASRESSNSKEIHYHYHINNNKEVNTAKFDTSTISDNNRHHHHIQPGYGAPSVPSPPSPNYGPPHHQSSPELQQQQNHPPLQGYGSPSPPPSRSHYSKPPNSFDSTSREDHFKRKTFFVPSSRHKPVSIGYRPRDSWSKRPPSTSYEVPPEQSSPEDFSLDTPPSSSGGYNTPSPQPPPSTAYGPPGFNKPSLPSPSPSYGPPNSQPEETFSPASPPAPPPLDQYETTITLQTIPVQRTVTELVQVPNVVHKISSSNNRPFSQQDDIQTQTQVINTPSLAYGIPQSPHSSHTHSQSQPHAILKPKAESFKSAQRPFDSHLAQILGVGPTQNPKDTILQELLLGNARNPSNFDINLSDLELISLLQQQQQGSRGTLGSSLNARNIFGNLFGGGGGSSLQGLGNLNSDGLGSLREAFREQRYQLALADVRKQLREQNKENHKERSSYRNMFTKGALLMSALSLLPSFINPMASAAGVSGLGMGATGTSGVSNMFSNLMLPVVNIPGAGRRRRKRRSLQENSHLEFLNQKLYLHETSRHFFMNSTSY